MVAAVWDLPLIYHQVERRLWVGSGRFHTSSV